jgi:hypothetical protein
MTKFTVLNEIENDINRIKNMQDGLLDAYKNNIDQVSEFLKRLNELQEDYEKLLHEAEQL